MRAQWTEFVPIAPVISTREERSRCATRGLEPFSPFVLVRSPSRYGDPRSGTDFLVAAWPGRRLAA